MLMGVLRGGNGVRISLRKARSDESLQATPTHLGLEVPEDDPVVVQVLQRQGHLRRIDARRRVGEATLPPVWLDVSVRA